MSEMRIDMVLIFFVYGLAFFSMGLALMLESGRSPVLAEVKVLRPLALFGFLHGTHEWLEMALELGKWFELRVPAWTDWLRVALLAVSFICLIVFGLQWLRMQQRLSNHYIYAAVGFLILYFILITYSNLFYPIRSADLYRHVDAIIRYILAVPGAALASVTLHRQAQLALTQNRRRLAFSLRCAAWSFASYSLTQVFVPQLETFPAKFINSSVFLELVGMPIQVVRAASAVVITIGLIRAIQLAEIERQREFIDVQQSRLQALEQVQRELVERETMRQELLRHIVIAQEDERARIARELHDETAQILTAFSLNLAVMNDSLSENSRAKDLLNRLQRLSHQMSDGIYRMVHDLRPAQLDDLGVAAALQYLVEQEKKHGSLRINLEVNGQRCRLDPIIETVLFRVAQEALTNIVRHAQTDQAKMLLTFSTQQVALRVSDQGVGFDIYQKQIPPRGWGLAGMKERAESIGGKLQIQSAPGKGTVVEVVVPLQKEPLTT